MFISSDAVIYVKSSVCMYMIYTYIYLYVSIYLFDFLCILQPPFEQGPEQDPY